MPTTSIQEQAQAWLKQQGIFDATLRPLAGYTNYVFRIQTQQAPFSSILRLANHELAAGLCPLAHYPEHVIRLHQDAVELGLAPELLGSDAELGIMWLADVGERRALKTEDFPEIQTLLGRLHQSDLAWRSPDQIDLDTASLHLLQGLQNSPNAEVSETASRLLKLATQRGYAQYPLKPVHSDLNPGNWLHDGQRWWLIDWDYARLMVEEWDYASLIVEHGWGQTQAQHLTPHLQPIDLAWFCAAFALLSWDWHQQRGTEQVAQKLLITAYWLKYCA